MVVLILISVSVDDRRALFESGEDMCIDRGVEVRLPTECLLYVVVEARVEVA